jgi:hypothetical protein
MQWEELMRQFADVVGRALAKRWLAERLVPEKHEITTPPDSIGKEAAHHLHRSGESENPAERDLE